MNLKNSRFEWVCSEHEPSGQKFLRIFCLCGFIIFGILTISFMFFIPFLIITLLCAIPWGILQRRRKTEYEFNYFSEELTIFKISNSLRRKKKFTCTLDQISYIRKGFEDHLPTKKFYLNPEEVYSMQVNNSEGKNLLMIEVDERFLQLLDGEHKLRK